MPRNRDDRPSKAAEAARALRAVPAQLDRLSAQLDELKALWSPEPGAACGVVVDSIRETDLVLSQVRCTADAVTAAINLGYALRVADEQAESDASRSHLSSVPGGF